MAVTEIIAEFSIETALAASTATDPVAVESGHVFLQPAAPRIVWQAPTPATAFGPNPRRITRNVFAANEA